MVWASSIRVFDAGENIMRSSSAGGCEVALTSAGSRTIGEIEIMSVMLRRGVVA